MTPLPMKPLPFAVAYLGLAAADIFLQANATPGLRAAALLAQATLAALTAHWMWQALAIATEALPPGESAHRRKTLVARLLVVFAAIWVASMTLQLPPRLSAWVEAPLTIVGVLSILGAMALVAATVCRAEGRKDPSLTAVQFLFLPLTSPWLYGRLKGLQTRSLHQSHPAAA